MAVSVKKDGQPDPIDPPNESSSENKMGVVSQDLTETPEYDGEVAKFVSTTASEAMEHINPQEPNEEAFMNFLREEDVFTSLERLKDPHKLLEEAITIYKTLENAIRCIRLDFFDLGAELMLDFIDKARLFLQNNSEEAVGKFLGESFGYNLRKTEKEISQKLAIDGKLPAQMMASSKEKRKISIIVAKDQDGFFADTFYSLITDWLRNRTSFNLYGIDPAKFESEILPINREENTDQNNVKEVSFEGDFKKDLDTLAVYIEEFVTKFELGKEKIININSVRLIEIFEHLLKEVFLKDIKGEEMANYNLVSSYLVSFLKGLIMHIIDRDSTEITKDIHKLNELVQGFKRLQYDDLESTLKSCLQIELPERFRLKTIGTIDNDITYLEDFLLNVLTKFKKQSDNRDKKQTAKLLENILFNFDEVNLKNLNKIKYKMPDGKEYMLGDLLMNFFVKFNTVFDKFGFVEKPKETKQEQEDERTKELKYYEEFVQRLDDIEKALSLIISSTREGGEYELNSQYIFAVLGQGLSGKLQGIEIPEPRNIGGSEGGNIDVPKVVKILQDFFLSEIKPILDKKERKKRIEEIFEVLGTIEKIPGEFIFGDKADRLEEMFNDYLKEPDEQKRQKLLKEYSDELEKLLRELKI